MLIGCALVVVPEIRMSDGAATGVGWLNLDDCQPEQSPTRCSPVFIDRHVHGHHFLTGRQL